MAAPRVGGLEGGARPVYSTVMAGVAWTGVRRGAAIFAAVLALAVNVLVPAGFMTGGGSSGLVLCTGHGPVLVAADLQDQFQSSVSHGSKSKADGPCAFVGHGAAPSLATAPTLFGEATVWSPAAEPAHENLAVGVRLAAPPPPSQAPPSVLI